MFNCYRKEVDGRAVLRMEILRSDGAQVFITGLFADSMPEDPIGVLAKRARNYFERELSADEAAELEAAYAAV